MNSLGDRWFSLLSNLNSLLLASSRWQEHLTEISRLTGWCGLPPASEDDIAEAEKRLSVRLPPSYRSFVSLSNGWHPFSSFIELLLPLKGIDRLRAVDPENLSMIQMSYQEDELPDDDYTNYADDHHREALRHRYYPDCLLVGRGWGGRGEMALLNPRITFADGEWETIFFADWLPGNRRFRSFLDFASYSILTEQEL